MKPRAVCLAFVLAVFFATTLIAKGPKERTLTLEYVPQETTGVAAPTITGAMSSEPVALEFEDARPAAKPTVVGERSDENKLLLTWIATNSVAQFTKDILLENAAAWGIRIESEANPVLAIRLWRFFVTEKDQAIGSNYSAEVRVGFELKNSSGDVVVSGLVSGDARTYGRRRSRGNCNVVLSDAVKKAYANLLRQPALQEAWGRATSQPELDTSALTPDGLLNEILTLKKKGFAPETVIRYISQQKLSAPLTADDMIDWKEAGVTEPLIQAALELSPLKQRP